MGYKKMCFRTFVFLFLNNLILLPISPHKIYTSISIILIDIITHDFYPLRTDKMIQDIVLIINSQGEQNRYLLKLFPAPEKEEKK